MPATAVRDASDHDGSIIDYYILTMVIFRDVLVTAIRISMQSKGVVMKTSRIAKIKTTIQFSVITILFLKLISILNFNEEIIATNLNTNEEHRIEFANEEGCSIGASPASIDYDSKDWIRVGFSSMKTEARVYDYNCKTKKLVLKKKQTIPSGHDNTQYVCKRILTKSKDGEVNC